MIDFLGTFRKIKKEKGNTTRIIALLIWIESLTIIDLYYAKNRCKKDLLREKKQFFSSVKNGHFPKNSNGGTKAVIEND